MITLHPDKIIFNGPHEDGGWTIKLKCGSYEEEAISQLVTLKKDQVLSVVFQEPADFRKDV